MISVDAISVMRNKKQVFSNVSMRIKKNEKRLILGASGCGKTTFLKALIGFEPIQSGHVSINETPVDPVHISQIRQQVFYLSQDIDLPKIRLSDFLSSVFSARFNPGVNLSLQNEFLAEINLDPDIVLQNCNSLSGGERQRIGLFIGCMINRPVWLLDEPTSALDADLKQKIAKKIMRLNHTMIIVSHDTIWQADPSINIQKWG
jgi:putative ABC transport system ATP-binding protein